MQNVHEESAAAEVAEVSKSRKNLLQITANYASQNIYNMDETTVLSSGVRCNTGYVSTKRKEEKPRADKGGFLFECN